MKIGHVDLWDYVIEWSASDCDGRHYEKNEFTDHRKPTKVVYDNADLFAAGGPSVVSLVEDSTRDNGTAYVSHATDEGSESFDITWHRVDRLEKLSAYLLQFESPEMTLEMQTLYRRRIRALLSEKFEGACALSVEGVASKDPDSVRITSVYGGGVYALEPLWQGDGTEMPFTAETIKQIISDLALVDDAEYGDDHIVRV